MISSGVHMKEVMEAMDKTQLRATRGMGLPMVKGACGLAGRGVFCPQWAYPEGEQHFTITFIPERIGRDKIHGGVSSPHLENSMAILQTFSILLTLPSLFILPIT